MITKGKLSSGKKYEFVISDKSAVTEGKHWILRVVDDLKVSKEEKKELLFLAYDFTKNAVEEGRWRIGFNGPGQRKKDTVHIHIIFPVGNDDLPRFVDKIEEHFKGLAFSDSITRPLGSGRVVESLSGNDSGH